MSVHAIKPKFTTYEDYRTWSATWRIVYRHISDDIRRRTLELKARQRDGEDTKKLQNNLCYLRQDAHQMNTLISDAKERWQRIRAMKQQMVEQRGLFPLTLDARVVDFSFNKISNEFPFMPRWLVKASGRTYYIDHIDALVGFSTRELDDPKTRGMLRFRACTLTIDESGTAIITERARETLAA